MKSITKLDKALAQSLITFFLCLLFSQTSLAVEKISLDVDQIYASDWQLKNVSLSLSSIQKKSQQFSASIKQMALPAPFADIKFFDIHCLSFNWQHNKIICQRGTARLKSAIIESSPFAFSFLISEKQSHFDINNLQFGQGTVSLNGTQHSKNWNVTMQTKDVLLTSILPYVTDNNTVINELKTGQLDAQVQVSGTDLGLDNLLLKLLYEKVTLNANEGKIATDSLDFSIDMLAERKDGIWYWQNENQILQGELYLEPVYLKIDEKLTLKADGQMDQQDEVVVNQANFNHPNVVNMSLLGIIKENPEPSIEQGDVKINVSDLARMTDLYIAPYTEQTGFEGIKLQGQLQAELDIKKASLKNLSMQFVDLEVSDINNRIAMKKGIGDINWTYRSEQSVPSTLQWESLAIKAIPIDAGELSFLLKNKTIDLLEQASIPLMGGFLDIKQFNIDKMKTDEPKVFFAGGVTNVSLEQLTLALDWTPLTGNISGYIPGVDYQNKKLTVAGELNVNVFDGAIKINKLASSGLFTDFSKFYLDMEIDNLDLHAITQKLKIGGMEGRISGFVNDLYLENWKPVTFYAWLGTPEDDDSRHRISQKAIENIASIGGGGAADVISKGFLRFFDTFGYDRLGFGCYLHDGVCQLMGVEASGLGYYIIKGGGLPRIDVMGFNPQVDWNVLIERLSRINTTDEIVVE